VIEVVIERWSNADGSTDYRWSLWKDGRRLKMAATALPSAGECESEALADCRRSLNAVPDRVTHL